MKNLTDIMKFVSKDTIYEKLDINKVNLDDYDKSSIINNLELCLGYKLELIAKFYKCDTYTILDNNGCYIQHLHIDIYKKDSAIRITYDSHSLDFDKRIEYSNKIVTYKIKDILKLQGRIKNIISYVKDTGELLYSWTKV